MVKSHLRAPPLDFLLKKFEAIPEWVNHFLMLQEWWGEEEEELEENLDFYYRPTENEESEDVAIRLASEKEARKKRKGIVYNNRPIFAHFEIEKARNPSIGDFTNINPAIREHLAGMLNEHLSINQLGNEAEHYIVGHFPNCYDRIVIDFTSPYDGEKGIHFIDDEKPAKGRITGVEITVIRESFQHHTHTTGFRFQINGTDGFNWSRETSIIHADKFCTFSRYIAKLCQHSGHSIGIIF